MQQFKKRKKKPNNKIYNTELKGVKSAPKLSESDFFH